MLEAVRYNVAHLVDFAGREDRPTFWWYVLFLVIIDVVIGVVLSGPLMVGTVATAIHAAQSGASDDAVRVQILQQSASQMQPMVWVSVGIGVVMIALTAAAFVRRLHDSGNSGWWAAVAIIARLVALAVTLTMIGAVGDLMATGNVAGMAAQQAHMARFGLIGWIAPIIVIVFGVMNTTPGPNRYGEAPQAG